MYDGSGENDASVICTNQVVQISRVDKGSFTIFWLTYLPHRAAQARAHRAKLLFGLAALGAAAELHGDMTQAARLASLDTFRKVYLEIAHRMLLSLRSL